MQAVDTYEVDGVKVELHYDETPFSPRENCNLATMVCWHPDYMLGDEQVKDANGRGAVETVFETETGRTDFRSMRTIARYLGIARQAVCILPLILYDHSGITMRVGHVGDIVGDSAGWDTSFVGFIYTTAERIRELCGDPREGDAFYCPSDWDGTPEEWIEKQLRDEVKEYASYLEGDVYGYVVTAPDGEEDSCWGFIGYEYAKQEADWAAKDVAEDYVERTAAEARERERAANQDIATV